MELKNSIGIETSTGYKAFELYEGDITSVDAKADILVASAFSGSYHPTPGTVLGALYERFKLDVRVLKPDLDLRQALGLWISGPLETTPFRWLILVDLVGGTQGISQALRNVFVGAAILEAQGHTPATLAMPMLGAGQQAVDPATVVEALLPAAEQSLRRAQHLRRILFIETNHARVAQLDAAINQFLGRVHIAVPKSELVAGLRRDIANLLDGLAPRVPEPSRQVLLQLRRTIVDEGAQSFAIGTLGRKLVECIIATMFPRKTTNWETLSDRIHEAVKDGFAPWIGNYMHSLRVFGNEAAHLNGSKTRPPHVGEEDLAIALLCLHSLLRFWATELPNRA